MTNNNREEEKIVPIGEEETEQEIRVEMKKDRFLPISIIVAAVLICGAILFSVLYRGKPAPAAPVAGPAPLQASTTTFADLMALGPRDAVLGDSNASVTIIEYGDYQCPFCTRYFTGIQPVIKSQYIDTGKAKMVFRDFPFLGSESTAAANAAQCAEDQNQLWAYHDALYAAKVVDEGKNSNAEGDGFFTRTEFLNLAAQLGLNMQTFTSCLDGNQHANDVSAEQAAAISAGIGSTPTTIVNGKLVAEADGSGAGADPTAVLGAIANAVGGQ